MAVSSILRRAKSDAGAAFLLSTSASSNNTQARLALTVQTRGESPIAQLL